MVDLPPDDVVVDVPPDLPARTEGISVSYAATALRSQVPGLVDLLARLEAYPVATASPQERADLLDLREGLDLLGKAIRTRIGAIDLAFRRGFEDLGARELPIPGYTPIRYTPDEGSWEVDADGMRRDLLALAAKTGQITPEDVERAFKIVVTTTADNRVLNGLMKRGSAVEDAIHAHRTRREGVPMNGKLTLPRRRNGEEAADREEV